MDRDQDRRSGRPRPLAPLMVKKAAGLEAKVTQSTNNDALGVSVYHLEQVFLEEEVSTFRVKEPRRNRKLSRLLPTSWFKCAKGAYLSRESTFHEIENLQGPPGVIRTKSASTICPLDGKHGAAYVHCLEGADHVGPANFMLSYSWDYTVGDVVDSLVDFCRNQSLDPFGLISMYRPFSSLLR